MLDNEARKDEILQAGYEAQMYQEAEKRVRAKVSFYWHIASYLVVNGFLIIIYLLTVLPEGKFSYPWFIWPLVGWGLGLVFHFLAVFVLAGHDSAYQRQRMVEAELQRMGKPGQPVQNSYSRPANEYSK